MKSAKSLKEWIKENGDILGSAALAVFLGYTYMYTCMHTCFEAGKKWQADFDANLIWDHRHDSVLELIKAIIRL